MTKLPWTDVTQSLWIRGGDDDGAKRAVLDTLVCDSKKAIDNFELFVQQHTTLSKDILPLIAVAVEKAQDNKQQ
jgi:hypothetical protein